MPLRVRKRYETEHTLIAAFLFGNIIVPLIFACIWLDGWTDAMRQAGMGAVLAVVAIGFGWGLGTITWAYGVRTVGMGIALATIMGINIAFGSTIPMLRKWDEIPSVARMWTFIGIAICVAGVVVCGRAGHLRERAKGADRQRGECPDKKMTWAFAIGLASCVFSGFLCACANIAYDLGQPIKQAMDQMGTDARISTLAAWMPVWFGGYVSVLAVSVLGIIRKRTLRRFTGPGSARDFVLAVLVMGGSQLLGQGSYGVGAYYIGENLGRTVGWAVSMALTLIVANILGFVTGEWKGAAGATKKVLYAGLAVLMIAMACLAYANGLQDSRSIP